MIKRIVIFVLNEFFKHMNKKLLQLLTDKCKDMGLTEKAIQDLVTAGSDGLKEDTPDTDIEARANQLFNYAKITQGESTRWAQKTKEQQQTEIDRLTAELNKSKGGQGGKGGNIDELPESLKEWQKNIETEFSAMKKENDTLKSEREMAARSASIIAKAKELLIPEWRIQEGFSIADTDDDTAITQKLTAIKQNLVTAGLDKKQEGVLSVGSTSDEAAKKLAEQWAKDLPDA